MDTCVRVLCVMSVVVVVAVHMMLIIVPCILSIPYILKREKDANDKRDIFNRSTIALLEQLPSAFAVESHVLCAVITPSI